MTQCFYGGRAETQGQAVIDERLAAILRYECQSLNRSVLEMYRQTPCNHAIHPQKSYIVIVRGAQLGADPVRQMGPEPRIVSQKRSQSALLCLPT